MFDISGRLPIRLRFDFSILLALLVTLMGLSVARAAQPVTVTNPVTIANPVTSVSVNNPDPSRQAFSATFAQSATTTINASFGTIPAGKRLVIENESVACYVY